MNPPPTVTASWGTFSGRQHTTLEWEAHYELIKTLYLVRDLKLWQIKDIMAREYGFRATDAQYKRFITKYKLEKNVKHDVREWIAAKRRKRSVEGKDTQVFLNGRVVRMERLGAWREEAEEDLPPTPKGVEYCTPRYSGPEGETEEYAAEGSSYPSAAAAGAAGARPPIPIPAMQQHEDPPASTTTPPTKQSHKRSHSNPTSQAMRHYADHMLNKLELEDFHSGYAFNHREALDFLLRNSSGTLCPTSPSAHTIVSTLATSFPALELAGTYIALHDVSAEEYISLLQTTGKGLSPLLSAFEVTFAALQRASYPAAALLLTCSHLHHSHIPHVLLQRSSSAQDPTTLTRLLGTLTSYRLIRPETFNRSFSVDPVIHAHLRKLAGLDEGLQSLRMVRTAVMAEGRVFGNRILPHVKACLKHLRRFEHQGKGEGVEVREGLAWLAGVVEGAT